MDLVRAVVVTDHVHCSRVIARLNKARPEITASIKYTRLSGKGQLTPTALPEDCKKILACLLAGARIPAAKKSKALELMGMAPQMRQYAEAEVMHPLVTAFAHLGPLQQFSVGSYRIDLHFPNQKLAVECDEHGHNHYDATKEAARQQFIQTQLGCRFHRFDPYEDGFCLHRLTGQLMQLLTDAK